MTTPNRPLSVLTWNLYLGADAARVIGASPADLTRRTSEFWKMVESTGFKTRAAGLAKVIASKKPDVVSLQEVYRWSRIPPGEDGPDFSREEIVEDFFELLGQALAETDVPYALGPRSFGVNAVLPTLEGGAIRLEDSVALLVRKDSSWRQGIPRVGRFSRRLRVPLDGEPFDIERAWVALDLHQDADVVRVIGTHVEFYSAEVQPAQVEELLAVPASVVGPIILTGDFNSRPGSPAAQRLSEAGFQDAWDVVGVGEGLTSSEDEDLRNPETALYERIDWIQVRGGLKPIAAIRVGDDSASRTGDGRWLSDHCGVFASLVLEPHADRRPVRPRPVPLPVEPEAVVRQAIQCFQLGNLPALLDLMHPESPFHLAGDPKLTPWAQPYRGAGLMRYFIFAGEHLDCLVIQPLSIQADGATVYARLRKSWRAFPARLPAEAQIKAEIQVVNGKILEWNEKVG